jgi:hypothetical protein
MKLTAVAAGLAALSTQQLQPFRALFKTPKGRIIQFIQGINRHASLWVAGTGFGG